MKTSILAAIAALSLCSCQSLPVNVAYKTNIAGHDVAAAYSSSNGLTLYGQKRTPVRPQK